MTNELYVNLRRVRASDLPIFYRNQADPVAATMAKVHSRTVNEFNEHWNRILADPNITLRAIESCDQLAGCITCFPESEHEWIGYWIGQEFWGRGIATCALKQILPEIQSKTIRARVAEDNLGSQRVLEKCGFQIIDRFDSEGTPRYMACREVLFELNRSQPGRLPRT